MEIQAAVNRFRGDYAFLSNFYPAKILYEGISYYHAEAAYQAQKCSDPAQRQAFSQLYSDESKRMGRNISVREDWDTVKLEVMENVVRAKFEQNPRLAQLLLATDEMQLIEGNTWHDVFWGVDLKTGEGENHLGEILMRLRASFRLHGITDRSLLRPIREYRAGPRFILTDEAMEDIHTACRVVEVDDKSVPDLKVSEAMLESSSNDTIFVCSPVYGKHDEMYLRACYVNTLDIAAEQEMKSIAFPVISVGSRCFPKQKAAQIAVAAVREWLACNPDMEITVYLVPEDLRVFCFAQEEMICSFV